MTQIAATPGATDFRSDALVPGGLLAWERDRFDRVTASLDLHPTTICALHCANRSLIVEIPLARDDGSMTVLTGYRVQHSSALGPAKGGTRFRPGVHLDDEAKERRQVLDRLDRSWELLATRPHEAWRDHTLGTAITRVTKAMSLTGEIAARHQRNKEQSPREGCTP